MGIFIIRGIGLSFWTLGRRDIFWDKLFDSFGFYVVICKIN